MAWWKLTHPDVDDEEGVDQEDHNDVCRDDCSGPSDGDSWWSTVAVPTSAYGEDDGDPTCSEDSIALYCKDTQQAQLLAFSRDQRFYDPVCADVLKGHRSSLNDVLVPPPSRVLVPALIWDHRCAWASASTRTLIALLHRLFADTAMELLSTSSIRKCVATTANCLAVEE